MTNRIAGAGAQVRHLAFQIAAQLPDDTAEALRVLEYTRKLVLHTVEDPEPPVHIVKPSEI